MEGREKETGKTEKRRLFATIWQVLCWVTSSFLKVTCLIAFLLMISALFLAGYHYLLNSPYIRLERVTITGVEDSIRRELLELSGLRANMTLLAVNLKDLRKNLERHPWVRTVEVEKEYPHTLTIKAVPEEPLALVSRGGLHYMNRRGKIFKSVEAGEDVDFPVVTGEPLNEGGGEEALRLAARVLVILHDHGEDWMKEEISEVHLKGLGNVSLYFRDLPAAVQVNVRDMEQKIGDLARVVAHLKENQRVREVKVINLHYRDGAVVSFKKG